MGYAAKRRYPRIPFAQNAEVEFLDPKRRTRVKAPVAIAEIACEGLGLVASQPLGLRKKTRLNVKFTIDDNILSLPAAVVWSAGSQLGVHLLLELAMPDIRQSWGHWIVEKTSAHRAQRRKARTSKKYLNRG